MTILLPLITRRASSSIHTGTTLGKTRNISSSSIHRWSCQTKTYHDHDHHHHDPFLTKHHRRSFATTSCSNFEKGNDNAVSGGGNKYQEYDVFIVGGGVVGATLAKRISEEIGNRYGLSIGVLDTRRPPPLSSFPCAPSKDESSSSSSSSVSESVNQEEEEVVVPNARAYALSPSSLVTLGNENGDVVDRLRNMGRVAPYDKMQVWESNGPGTLRFNADDIASHPDPLISSQSILGAVIEDGPLVSSIWDSLTQQSEKSQPNGGNSMTMDLIAPAKVLRVVPPTTTSNNATLPHVQLTYQNTETGDEHTIQTRLLVAADGANSFIRKSVSIPTSGYGFGRKAVISTVKLSSGARNTMNGTAFQRFFPSGPLALLPTWGNYANVVWSTTSSHAHQLVNMSHTDFTSQLNDALQAGPTNSPSSNIHNPAVQGLEALVRTIGEGLAMSSWMTDPFALPPVISHSIDRRFAFDLQTSHAQSYAVPRIALVGDAAHTIHPMAGQGLNLGIADAECLFQQIRTATESGMDCGDMCFLEEYASERSRVALATMGGIQALHSAFSTEVLPLVWARSIGVNLVNAAGPVRRKLAEVASGASSY